MICMQLSHLNRSGLLWCLSEIESHNGIMYFNMHCILHGSNHDRTTENKPRIVAKVIWSAAFSISLLIHNVFRVNPNLFSSVHSSITNISYSWSFIYFIHIFYFQPKRVPLPAWRCMECKSETFTRTQKFLQAVPQVPHPAPFRSHLTHTAVSLLVLVLYTGCCFCGAGNRITVILTVVFSYLTLSPPRPLPDILLVNAFTSFSFHQSLIWRGKRG